MNLSIKSIIILFVYCSIINTASAQSLIQRCKLPTIVNESSGVEINAKDTSYFWTNNDSGDSAYLYKVSTDGILLRKLKLIGVNAVDIEELAQDNDGNYYVGDFGNNNNDRTDLTIYKITNPDSITSDSVLPQAIHFSYPDQTAFPPSNDYKKNFNCEAMFHFGSNLYLFSKNKMPFTACKMYMLPDSAGTYVASLLDDFNINSAGVTSADISLDSTTVVLLNEFGIHVFKNFAGNNFFQGSHSLIDLASSFTQKEAIVFIDNYKAYITDEKNSSTDGNLYYIDINNPPTNIKTIASDNFKLYPNPACNQIIIEGKELTKLTTVEVLNTLGQKQIIRSKLLENKIELETDKLPNGTYQVVLKKDNKSIPTQMSFTKQCP